MSKHSHSGKDSRSGVNTELPLPTAVISASKEPSFAEQFKASTDLLDSVLALEGQEPQALGSLSNLISKVELRRSAGPSVLHGYYDEYVDKVTLKITKSVDTDDPELGDKYEVTIDETVGDKEKSPDFYENLQQKYTLYPSRSKIDSERKVDGKSWKGQTPYSQTTQTVNSVDSLIKLQTEVAEIFNTGEVVAQTNNEPGQRNGIAHSVGLLVGKNI